MFILSAIHCRVVVCVLNIQTSQVWGSIKNMVGQQFIRWISWSTEEAGGTRDRSESPSLHSECVGLRVNLPGGLYEMKYNQNHLRSAFTNNSNIIRCYTEAKCRSIIPK